MKHVKHTALGIILAGLFFLCASQCLAFSKEEIVGYCSFDDKSKVDFSAFEGVGISAYYTPVAGVKGQGLNLNAKRRAEIIIPAKNNIRWFSVSFWLKPLSWPRAESSSLSLFYGANLTFSLTGDLNNQTWYSSIKTQPPEESWPAAFFPFSNANYPSKFAPGVEKPVVSQNKWQHIAINIGPNGAEYFFNGKRIALHDGMLRPDILVTRLVFPSNADDLVIDDLYIFDRPLYESEVKLLASVPAAKGADGLSVSPSSFTAGASKVRYDILGQKIEVDARTPLSRYYPFIALELTDSDGTRIAETEAKFITSTWTHFTLPINNVPLGAYQLKKVKRQKSNSQSFVIESIPFEKITNDTWETASRLGKEDKVVKYFEPIQFDAGKRLAKISERTIEWADTGLPQQIYARAESLLQGPITLYSFANQKTTKAVGIDWNVKKVGNDSLETVSRIKLGNSPVENMEGTVETRLEYDGFIWIKLNLQAKENTKLDTLFLDIPFKTSQATSLYGDLWAPNPKDKDTLALMGKMENMVHLDQQSGSGEIWSAPFLPFVWLGNVDRGLAWFTDSEKNLSWPMKDTAKKSIQVMRSGDAAKSTSYLRIILNRNLILKAGESKSYEFGLMATPIREIQKDMTAEARVSAGAITNTAKLTWVDTTAWSTYFSDPLVPDSKAFKEKVKSIKQSYGLGFLPYFNSTQLATGNWLPLYFQETAIMPYAPMYPNVMVPPAGDFLKIISAGGAGLGVDVDSQKAQDFLVWCAKFVVESYGTEGIYLDNDLPYQSQNSQLGKVFTNDQGQLAGAYSLFGHRNLHKRIRVMYDQMEQQLGRRLWLIAHGTISGMTGFSFTDAFLDGERFRYINQRDYIGSTDQGMISAEFSPYSHGIPITFLPEVKKDAVAMATTEATENMLTMLAVNGIPVIQAFSRYDVIEAYWKALDEFGTKGAAFIPFWKLAGSQATIPDNLKISAYVKDNKILYVIGNFSDSAFKGAVNLPGDFVKWGNILGGKELRSGASIPISQGRAEIEVKPKNYILVRVSDDLSPVAFWGFESASGVTLKTQSNVGIEATHELADSPKTEGEKAAHLKITKTSLPTSPIGYVYYEVMLSSPMDLINKQIFWDAYRTSKLVYKYDLYLFDDKGNSERFTTSAGQTAYSWETFSVKQGSGKITGSFSPENITKIGLTATASSGSGVTDIYYDNVSFISPPQN